VNTAKYFYLNFIKKEKISRDVFGFYFDRVKRGSLKQLNFLAGQYIHLYLPVAKEKGRGNSRMFTIASSPLERDYLLIATKKGKSIFKKNLFKLIPQTPVKFYGPSGGLVVNAIKNPSYIFLALGIGITPFRSMIKYVNKKNLSILITLLVSFSKKEDFCFYDELMDISKSNQNIRIIYSSTRINDKFIKKHIKNMNEHVYYIVGSPKAVLDLEEIVLGMGISSNKIFIENFEGY